jgi:hypothetical protein
MEGDRRFVKVGATLAVQERQAGDTPGLPRRVGDTADKKKNKSKAKAAGGMLMMPASYDLYSAQRAAALAFCDLRFDL